jgi:hypothetical protein
MRQFVNNESGAIRRKAPAPNASYSAGGYRGSARAQWLTPSLHFAVAQACIGPRFPAMNNVVREPPRPGGSRVRARGTRVTHRDSLRRCVGSLCQHTEKR